jgi:hypothetical protein
MPKQSVSSDSHNLIDIPHVGIIALPKELPMPIQTSLAQHAHELTHESGAPVDFGGRVLPNPKGITSQLDTDIGPPKKVVPERYMENVPITGTHPPISAAPNPNAPQMDIRNAKIPGLQGLETDVEPRLQ